MNKVEFENLDEKIQEYIKYCISLGVINEENKKYMLEKLSKTIVTALAVKLIMMRHTANIICFFITCKYLIIIASG